MKEGWKTLAIILIVTQTITLLGVYWVWSLGSDILYRETECSVNICGDEKYDRFYYDDIEKICYCYKNHEIVHQEFIG